MGSLNGLEDQNDTNGLSNDMPKLLDTEELRRQGHIMVDFVADYYKNIENYPVRSQVEPGYLRKRLPEKAPMEPESLEAILADVRAHIVPGLTHWMSPNYHAYYPNSGSTAGFLGEILCSGFNPVGFNWISSPAATELESLVMDWLGSSLGLPDQFLFSSGLGGGGVIQGTTCEAILCTLVAARDQALRADATTSLRRLTVYCSDQTHSAFTKAASIAGLDPGNFRVIPTGKETWFSMCPNKLREAVEADVAAGFTPVYVLATVGTTSTSAVDPLRGIGRVAADHGMWVHVDAAYAGSACLCPEFRHFFDGVESATSFSFNAHKWMFTQLDCCCLWVRDSDALVRSLSTDPEYLRNKATESRRVVDYKDWQVPLSRRFRSLKLWMVLRSYGIRGLRDQLRRHVDIARGFEACVRADPRFEVVVPRHFSMVCFRLIDGNAATERLMDSINASGRACMTHSVVGGVYLIRFVVGATLTEERHVAEVWGVISDLASHPH